MKYKLTLITVSILLAIWICGCSIPIRLETHSPPKEENQERNQILNIFDRKGRLIIIAFEKNGIPILDTARELKDYGKSDFEGFIEYSFRRGYPFSNRDAIIQIWGEDYLDEMWLERKSSGKIAEIRKTYNLLLEIEGSENGNEAR